MTERLSQCWESVRSNKKAAFVPFIMAGHPHPDTTVPLLHALVAGGADIIELGIPFSDPMADGPTIEAAGHVALSHKVSLRDVLTMVLQFRETNNTTPIILMGYYNPIYRYGAEAFAADAKKAGIDGCIVVDLPAEEAHELAPHLAAKALHMVMLATPTSTESRLQTLLSHASGQLYYVAVNGITGSASADYSLLADQVAAVKAETDLPITVGFGIKTPEDVKQVAAIADGVVVGSALVKHIESLNAHATDAMCEEVKRFISSLASSCK